MTGFNTASNLMLVRECTNREVPMLRSGPRSNYGLHEAMKAVAADVSQKYIYRLCGLPNIRVRVFG